MEEGVAPIWIALRGGVIVSGFCYRNDEFVPKELARWCEAASMAEVDAQYWMVRREDDPIPDPPQ